MGPLNTEYISNNEISIIRVRKVGRGKIKPNIVPTAIPNIAIIVFLKCKFPLFKKNPKKTKVPRIHPTIEKMISIQGYRFGLSSSMKYPCNQKTLAVEIKRPTANIPLSNFSRLYLIAIIISIPLTTAIDANKKPSRNCVVEFPSPGMNIPVAIVIV